MPPPLRRSCPPVGIRYLTRKPATTTTKTLYLPSGFAVGTAEEAFDTARGLHLQTQTPGTEPRRASRREQLVDDLGRN
jgi:hypothetical protein